MSTCSGPSDDDVKVAPFKIGDLSERVYILDGGELYTGEARRLPGAALGCDDGVFHYPRPPHEYRKLLLADEMLEIHEPCGEQEQ